MADLLESHVTQLKAGIGTAFDNIEAKFVDLIYDQTLPFIGDALKDQYNAQINNALTYIRQVKAQMLTFLDTVDTADDRAEAFVENGLNGALSSLGLGVDVVLNAGDVSITLSGSKAYTHTLPLDSNLGLGPLELGTSGTVEARLAYGINLGIGVDSNGFYVAAPSGDEIALDIDIGAPNMGDPVFNADAHLGFLNFNASDNGSVLDAGFKFNLTDGDGRLHLSELANIGNYASATVGADAHIDIHLAGDMGSDAFPSISADLVVDWDIAAGTQVNPSGGFISGGVVPTVKFANVEMDLGSFMNDFVKPFLDEIYKVIQPIATALAVLNTDIKALKAIPTWSTLFDKTGAEDGGPDQKITVLDFLKLAQPGIDLSGVIKLMNMVDTVIDWVEFFTQHSFGPNAFSIGDFTLDGDIRALDFVLSEIAPALTEGGEGIAAAIDRLSGGIGQTIDPATHDTGVAILETMIGDPNFSLPILSNPASIFGLLTGKTVDLLSVDLPSIDISLSNVTLASWSVFPTVWLDLYGSLELLLDLGIGYDTRGLSQFVDSSFSDFTTLLNGIYLKDFDANGNERPEITIGAEINVIGNFDLAVFELGGGGGIKGEIFFDLSDDLWTPNSPAGRIYLDSMAQALSQNLFSIFETSGRITAGLTAYAKLLGYEVWRANSPRVTLGSFSFDNPVLDPDNTDPAPLPGLGDLSGSTLLVNIGSRAGERDIANKTDGDESVEIGLVSNKVTIVGFDNQQSFVGVTAISANGGIGDDEIILDSAISVSATLSGGAGDDVLAGGSGADSLSGGDNRDTLQGAAGNDTLDGGEGDDILYGGAGWDSFVGGGGRDVVTYFDATTGILIDFAHGLTGGDQAEGDSFSGIEIIEGSEHDDTLIGAGSSDTFVGFGGHDSLSGGANADVLIGNAGNDTLDGGAANDIMVGGMGDDVYFVDDINDQVSENRINEIVGNGGHDSIYSAIDYDLTAFSFSGNEAVHDLRDIEDLYLTGTARQGKGNALANKITGTTGNDTLYGMDGADTLIGGDGADKLYGQGDGDSLVGGIGNDTLDGGTGTDTAVGGAGADTYYVDAATDVIVELGSDAGYDVVRASTNYTLQTGVSIELLASDQDTDTSNLELTGNEIAQTVRGNKGANTLEGRDGADTLEGGDGVDTATYRNATTGVVIDLALASQVGGEAQGDQYSSIEIYEGSGHADTLTGTSSGDHLRGIGGADKLYGLGGHDSLVGGTGNDTFYGGLGNDTTVGGSGDDLYYVDSLSDVVDETTDGGSGVDHIIADLNYSLGGNEGVENLTITGVANQATGNGQNNVIASTAHADTIDGSLGADTMYGGDGNDVYLVDSLGDEARELSGEGVDTIKLHVSSLASSTLQAPDPIISYTMNTWGAHVENLQMDVEQTTWRINVEGNARDNRISGNQRDNVITALGGHDTIVAGGGEDSIYGGDGNDRAEFVWDSLRRFDYFDGGADTDVLAMDWSAATHDITYYADAYRTTYYAFAPNEGNNTEMTFHNVERFELYGGSGHDALIGGSQGDTLSGGGGNDKLIGGAGPGTYDGGEGIDYVEATVATNVGLNFSLALLATQTSEQVSNLGTGIETRWKKIEFVKLTTAGGNDTLDARLNAETNLRQWSEDGNEFSAGSGDDTFLVNYNANGYHYFDAGIGTDKVYIDFSAATHNIGYYADAYGQRQYVYSPYNGGEVTVHYVGAERFDIYGGTGNDDLRGGSLDDTLSGGSGNDKLIGGAGKGVYAGGEGIDYVEATVATATGLDFNLALIAAQTAPQISNAGTGIETSWSKIEFVKLTTAGGNDTLDARLSAETNLRQWSEDGNEFSAGSGDDTFLVNYNANGYHYFDAGGGTDKVYIDFSAATHNIGYYSDAYGQRQYVYSPFSGSEVTVHFVAAERWETYGGSGNDDLRGGALDDTLSGGEGTDRLIGGTGKGVYTGGAGTDQVIASIRTGADTDLGLDFSLSLAATQTGPVTVNAGTAVETTWRGIELVDLTTGSGNDSLDASLSVLTDLHQWSLTGTTWSSDGGNDNFTVNYRALGQHGWAAGEGTDTLTIDWSEATYNIGYYSDAYGQRYYVYAPDFGRETSVGISNVERFRLTGGTGNDDLRGGALDDTLTGGGGSDRLLGGAGKGTYSGGTGVDFVETTIASAMGLDFSLSLSLAASQSAQQVANTGTAIETRWSGVEVVYLTLGAGNDTLDARLDTLTDTRIWSQSGNRFEAGAGNDTFKINFNAQGSHVFWGGDGTDTLVLDFSAATYGIGYGGYYFSAYDPNVGGNTGVEFYDVERFDVKGGSGNDVLSGKAGNDTLRGNAGDDTISGGDGTDTVEFTGAQSDYVVTDLGGGTFRYADQRVGGDGTDEVSNVETIVFLGTVPPSNSAPTGIALSAATIAEIAANGTVVGTLSATDADVGDSATYTLLSNGGGRFSISGSNLVVANSGLLNAEAATSHSVQVRVADGGGLTFDKTFTIGVTDVDEFNVGAVSDSNGTANAIAENVAVGTAVGIKASASDADATTNTVTYSLDNNAGGRFSIGSSDGVVRTAAAIDREATGASQTIVVRATSADGSSSTQSFTIAVTDVDEFNVGAVSDTNGATNAVSENVAIGTAVGIKASASDADATTNTVTYSLDNNAGGRFAIGSSDGVVRTAAAIDREATGSSQTIVVRATSADGSSSTQSFTIAVSDADEFNVGAVSDSNGTANAIAENVAVGTAVGIKATASDADATTNTITYSLDSNAGGRFSIGSSDGVVRTAAAIDREATGASQTIVVRATSADGSASTQSFTIAVSDVDEFNAAPITDQDSTAEGLTEGAAAGTAVGITVLSSDADATTNTITYSLDSNAGGLLTMGADRVVRLARTLDRETDGALVSFTVRASSADGSFSTRAFSFGVANLPGRTVPPDSKSTKIDGSEEEDSLDAGGGKDTISGLGGRDTIDGGAGIDTVSYAEKIQPVVVKLDGSKFVTVTVGGIAEDSIKNVENIIGGSGDDQITGDKGANVLTGGGGNDTLQGGAGKDTLDGGDGLDTADYSDKNVGVVVTLNGSKSVNVKVGSANEDTIKNIENVIGGAKNDKLTGDKLANVLIGGSGNDTLDGGKGDDTLAGNLGKDQLKGGDGKDVFRFDTPLAAANVDKITDFNVKDDTIELDDAIMSALAGGTWTQEMFVSLKSGNKATSLDQHIIYDQKTGNLWYDADGNTKGGVGPVQIAQLTTHPTGVTWQDFAIV